MSDRSHRADNVPDRFPVQVSRRVIVGAYAWTASVVFFIVQAVAQAASMRPFSLSTNLISDLGNTSCGPAVCSPLHLLVDAMFVVVGLLHWFGAVGLRQAWPAGRRTWAATILISLAGWGLAYAGIFSENVAPFQHRFGAVVGLVGLNAGALMLGWVLLPVARPLATLAIVGATVGVVGLLLFLVGAEGLPIGITERLADYPGTAVLIVVGGAVAVTARQHRT